MSSRRWSPSFSLEGSYHTGSYHIAWGVQNKLLQAMLVPDAERRLTRVIGIEDIH